MRSTKADEATFAALQAQLVTAVPPMLDEVAAALSAQWPAHAAALAGARGEVVRGAEAAMVLIVDVAHSMAAGLPPEAPAMNVAGPLFRQLGRGQARAGQSLAALLSAYQAGARAAWRHMARTCVGHGTDADTVAVLAESVFWLVDQLSAASAHGYTDEQGQAAAERERARAQLIELLLSELADPAAVAAAAERARWSVPERIVVVLVDDEALELDELGEPTWLPMRRVGAHGFLIPDSESVDLRAALTSRLRGLSAVVGVGAPPGSLRLALQAAQVTQRLRREGVLGEDPLFVRDHMDAVIVHQEPRLLDALQRQALAPLDGLAPEARARLEATLMSWLWHLGDHRRVAAHLHLHPQTIRYRMGQLRTLFGSALDDPSERLKLALSLAWSCPVPGADPDATGKPPS